jgi:hypothetical protein
LKVPELTEKDIGVGYFFDFLRGENVWYSHQTADGKWCRKKQGAPIRLPH